MKSEVVGSNVGDLARAAAQRNTPSHVIDELVSHEGDHERKDNEGFCVFGLLLVSVIQHVCTVSQNHIEVFEREIEIVAGAFYRPIGKRTPETMAAIASGPGFSEMSDQDWSVYHQTQAQKTHEPRDKADEKAEREDQQERQKFGIGSHGIIYPQPDDRNTSQEDSAFLPFVTEDLALAA